VLAGRRIPDLAREKAIPYRINRLDRTHTNRKAAPDEWIVLVCPRYSFKMFVTMSQFLIRGNPPVCLIIVRTDDIGECARVTAMCGTFDGQLLAARRRLAEGRDSPPLGPDSVSPESGITGQSLLESRPELSCRQYVLVAALHRSLDRLTPTRRRHTRRSKAVIQIDRADERASAVTAAILSDRAIIQ
jgi:hypothetical protein